MLIVAVAGFGTAALAGIAIAKSFTLRIAKNASVTNTKHTTVHENIVVDSHGRAVYTLSGDTTRHPKCTKANGCFTFWPPVKASSAKKLSKAPGIKGKLGVFHRNGMAQVTLGGHPLYEFSGDKHKASATGEGINGFGGIWHVSHTSGPKGPVSTGQSPTSSSTPTGSTTMPYPTTTMPSSTSTTTSTTPPPCVYPPYC
jgi:predicted lipoprotein with Yx(FWY)xxD motif